MEQVGISTVNLETTPSANKITREEVTSKMEKTKIMVVTAELVIKGNNQSSSIKYLIIFIEEQLKLVKKPPYVLHATRNDKN